MSIETRELKTIMARGYIAEIRKGRKAHKCDECGYPIEPGELHYAVIKGGGGLGWLKFPDRVHSVCLNNYLGGK